jgi:hypothetical protein
VLKGYHIGTVAELGDHVPKRFELDIDSAGRSKDGSRLPNTLETASGKQDNMFN